MDVEPTQLQVRRWFARRDDKKHSGETWKVLIFSDSVTSFSSDILKTIPSYAQSRKEPYPALEVSEERTNERTTKWEVGAVTPKASVRRPTERKNQRERETFFAWS